MIRFEDIPFGPTSATVEAPDLQDALDEIGMLTRLHQDARMLEAHVRHFYDVEPHVVPIARIDQEGHRYRGFRCLNTNCDITFKEEQGGQVWPGRYCAYLNGDNRPKLWDPNYSYDEILGAVGPETEYIRRFRVNVGEAGATPGRPPSESAGGARRQGPPPRGEHPDEDDTVPRSKFGGRAAPQENGSVEIQGLPEEVLSDLTELPVHVQEALKVRHEGLKPREGEDLQASIQECREEVNSWPDRFAEVAHDVLDEHAKRVFEPNDDLPF